MRPVLFPSLVAISTTRIFSLRYNLWASSLRAIVSGYEYPGSIFFLIFGILILLDENYFLFLSISKESANLVFIYFFGEDFSLLVKSIGKPLGLLF